MKLSPTAMEPYCRETVLLHSAFALVEKKALIPLANINRERSRELVGIISHTVEELMCGVGKQEELRKQLNAWCFTDMCRSHWRAYDEEMDKFQEFPPLPQFSIVFYVELVKELQWTDLVAQVRSV